ncbi:MAG TPA: response regulator [Methylomirabilota bacterium]|nr:response regulator [Methylomirabilota bacterium]
MSNPNPVRILIVDDDPTVVEMLSAVLRDSKQAYAIETASKGSDAIATLFWQRPNLVLLDIKLPDMSGIEVLKRIRKADPNIPVLMVSGNATETAFAEALKHGAFAYIPKPFNVLYIDHLVAAALATRRSNRRGPVPSSS